MLSIMSSHLLYLSVFNRISHINTEGSAGFATKSLETREGLCNITVPVITVAFLPVVASHLCYYRYFSVLL